MTRRPETSSPIHTPDPVPRRRGTLVTARNLGTAVDYLSRRDPDLGAIVAEHGPPPLWSREPGFPTLVQIILEQQVSLASARAVFDRLQATASPLTADRLLRLSSAQLAACGLTRQKAGYCRELATAIQQGALDLPELARADNGQARDRLTAVRGIGSWTADIYLLMALGRRDVWPRGDLALGKALRRIKRLPNVPDADEQHRLAEPWRPWRSVAARLLWHDYLARRKKTGDP